MRSVAAAALALAAVAAALIAQSPAPADDTILKAMVDELDRSKALKVVDLDKPYYIEYLLEDADLLSASASLGALVNSSHSRARVPQVRVRVGDYAFDNTNHVYSEYYFGARYDPEQWPLDNNYGLLRQCFWLATDRAYKTAVEAIARKRATLKNTASTESLGDFSKAEPVRNIGSAKVPAVDDAAWTNRVVKTSELFSAYPELFKSNVMAQVYRGVAYFANSEGSVERSTDVLVQFSATASAQAADGMPVHDLAVLPALDPAHTPPDAEVRRVFSQVAENVRALLNAPPGESYSGPVLFDREAAAQLMAQLVGDNLRVPRRPVSEPGRPAPHVASEFESRMGSRVLPEWMDVVDDATQTEWKGHRLIGAYPFDVEGIPPKPVVAVEKGILKAFLTTRQPVRNAGGSTGHARLGGNYGVRTAAISNLFVRASESKPAADLKAQLLDLVKQRGKPYGIIVRKLDYPTSASVRELQSWFPGVTQSGGASRPVTPPVLAYRVYPDGREELVRGLRFRSLNSRALRDILAASQETWAFDFVNNAAPFAYPGAGGYLAPSTVVSPALLFDEVELERGQEELARPPLVPPPPIESAGPRR